MTTLQTAGAGESEFWLTRFRPGWESDSSPHTWPDFALGAQIVSVWKDVNPCRLHFRVEGVARQPIDLAAPCAELIDAPAGVRGIHVLLKWDAGKLTLWLNGQRVAEAPLD